MQDSGLPTDTLILEAQAGNDRAREALYSRFRPILTRWAHGRVPASIRRELDTDDLVHEVLLGSLRRLDSFEIGRANGFLQYLKTSVLNAVRNRLRSKFTRTTLETAVQVEDPGLDPLEQLESSESRQRYEEALRVLDPGDRDLIIARIEFHMSYRDIAIDQGRPSADAARMAVKRAISRLAVAMARIGGWPP